MKRLDGVWWTERDTNRALSGCLCQLGVRWSGQLRFRLGIVTAVIAVIIFDSGSGIVVAN